MLTFFVLVIELLHILYRCESVGTVVTSVIGSVPLLDSQVVVCLSIPSHHI